VNWRLTGLGRYAGARNFSASPAATNTLVSGGEFVGLLCVLRSI
jgi:hypothetical protein